MAFNRFSRNAGFARPQAQAMNAALAPMSLEFPGTEIVSAEVCIFAGSDTPATTPCHISLVGNMNGSKVTAEAGRYDPTLNSQRLSLESVIAWADKHGLVEQYTEPERIGSAGDKYVVVHLINGKTAPKAAGFKKAVK